MAAAAVSIRSAIDQLDLKDAEALVVLTPHAHQAGVYRDGRGDLHRFGVPGVEVEVETWVPEGMPTIEGLLDHGAVVPLAMGRWELPVAVVAANGRSSPRFETDRRVAVIGSANLSAGLSARAPLTEVPGAAEAEDRFVETLRTNVGSITNCPLPGTCSNDLIATFAEIFAGSRARVLAHEAPVGVGYIVAEVV